MSASRGVEREQREVDNNTNQDQGAAELQPPGPKTPNLQDFTPGDSPVCKPLFLKLFVCLSHSSCIEIYVFWVQNEVHGF